MIETRLTDVSDLKIAPDAPHPELGCACGEGRLLTDGDAPVVKYWLPGVHDCAYIEERDLATDSPKVEVDAKREKRGAQVRRASARSEDRVAHAQSKKIEREAREKTRKKSRAA